MIALDANILQELLESRIRYLQVQKVLDQLAVSNEKFYISSLTVSHIFYLAEAHKIPMKRVEGLVDQNEIYGVNREDVTWALKYYGGNDFEDALQVAAARRAGAKLFVTLDGPLAKKYQKFLPITLVK